MTARQRMTMRAVVNRNTATGKDPDGNPKPPLWVDQTPKIPCWLWSEREREVLGNEVNVAIESLQLMVPLAANITIADRVNGVYDRRDQVIDAHVLVIEADRRIGASHRELAVRALA